MSYDDKLAMLASTLPVDFDGIEVARVAEAHKHPDSNAWVEGIAESLYETRQKLSAEFNSALDAIGDQRYRCTRTLLSALRDAIRLRARQIIAGMSDVDDALAGQLQPA